VVCHGQDFQDVGGLAENESKREPLEPETANVRRTFYGETVGSSADDLESTLDFGQIARTEAWSLPLIVGHLLQMFGLGSRMKPVGHLRSERAFCETTSPGINCSVPWSSC